MQRQLPHCSGDRIPSRISVRHGVQGGEREKMLAGRREPRLQQQSLHRQRIVLRPRNRKQHRCPNRGRQPHPAGTCRKGPRGGTGTPVGGPGGDHPWKRERHGCSRWCPEERGGSVLSGSLPRGDLSGRGRPTYHSEPAYRGASRTGRCRDMIFKANPAQGLGGVEERKFPIRMLKRTIP